MTTAPPKLASHQVEAVAWLREHPRGVYVGDMGAGKTASVLTALTPDMLPALVVGTKSVSETVWAAEAAVWRPDLMVEVAAGTPAQRAGAVTCGWADVVAVGCANLASEEDAIASAGFRTLVLDELSLYKAPSSTRSRVAARLARRMRYVWGLTGTPAPGSVADMWSQYRIIDGGARLGRSVTRFRDTWLTPGHSLPNGVVVGREDLPGAAEGVAALVAGITLVHGKRDLAAPAVVPVDIRYVQVPMGPKASRIYRQLLRKRVADVSDVPGGDRLPGGFLFAKDAARLPQILHQLTTGAVWAQSADGGQVLLQPDATRPKIATARSMLAANALDSDGGTLALYWFTHEKDALDRALAGLRTADTRDKGALDAWDSHDLDVLTAQPASAGHGLNLQRGGYRALWATLPWSAELWEQANRRLARRGQASERVQVTVLLATLDDGSPTIDDVIVQALRHKLEVQATVKRYLSRFGRGEGHPSAS